MQNKEYLAAAARAVAEQLTEAPDIHVALDPDVADYMGAFSEDAIVLADMIEDALLTINGQAEVMYEGR